MGTSKGVFMVWMTPNFSLEGCSRAKQALPLAGNIKEYDYYHAETTGVTEFIFINGKETAIEYRRDSVQAEVTSLNSFLVKSNDRIVVVGELSPLHLMTTDGEGMAQPEPYQEFRLLQWRVVPKAYVLRR